MRVWGNRSLGCRPASTQKRAAGFGRQTKVCSPSAAPKGTALTRTPSRTLSKKSIRKKEASFAFFLFAEKPSAFPLPDFTQTAFLEGAGEAFLGLQKSLSR